jgi:uncharacterized protein YfaS (alpha-2-macroglobulin family)
MENYNGRVRVMVVAGDGTAYGSAQQSVMVRKPVMLLGTLPRVIGTSEEMDVPATVFATEEGVGEVGVTIATSPGMTVVGPSRRTVNFSAAGDKTVTFRVRTSGAAGTGRVTITAQAKGEQSVWETGIEVRSVRREQTRLTTATVADGQTWNGNIALTGADGTNSLSLEISSIPPMNLAGRLRYLLGYPHGCLEQITSKSFPQLYVGGFAELTEKQQTESGAAIAETIRRYRSYQTAEGAFSYWPGGTSTDAFTSVYALHFMVEAEARGYLVPAALKRSVLANLKLVARGWRLPEGNYGRSEQFTQAYRLWVLALAGSAETGAMNRLREDASLGSSARWMLAAAYAAIERKDVATTLVSVSTPVSEVYDPEWDTTFGSSLRDRAVKLIVLTMLDRAAEAADLCREISGELSSDEWISTQSTAWALLAVSRYVEKWAADGRMRFTWDAGTKETRGSVNSEKSLWTTTVAEKAAAGAIAAKVENRGNGTLFVRALATGTPDQGTETAYSSGITLDVRFTDGAGRAMRVDSLAKGTAIVAVVTVNNPSPREVRNLVLTQIFPAGWEILSTRYLNDNASANPGDRDGNAAGISYRDIRDDRVYTYIDRLPVGRQVTVRLNLAATYGGRFYLPPVWCEAMYDNLVRANTEGRVVRVN